MDIFMYKTCNFSMKTFVWWKISTNDLIFFLMNNPMKNYLMGGKLSGKSCLKRKCDSHLCRIIITHTHPMWITKDIFSFFHLVKLLMGNLKYLEMKENRNIWRSFSGSLMYDLIYIPRFKIRNDDDWHCGCVLFFLIF